MSETERLLRLHRIIGDADAGIEPLIPVSKTTLYGWIKSGRFPAPRKLGRSSAWLESEVREVMQRGIPQ